MEVLELIKRYYHGKHFLYQIKNSSYLIRMSQNKFNLYYWFN